MTTEVRRVSLEECGLGVDRESLWNAFEPFALPNTAENDRSWNNGVSRRQKRIVKKLFLKTLGMQTKGTERTTGFVKDSYDAIWNEMGYSNYDPTKKHGNYTPWLWGKRRFLASTFGSARFRHLLLAALIEKLQPKSVLEIGCGNGINLLLLANRFPDVKFTGIDLTEAGPKLFKELQTAGELPENLAHYAPLSPREPTAFKNVVVQQGSAEHLPFEDSSFDFVMSVLALEQMERIRDKALSEMARVSAAWTLMIEPFREVNGYLWPRLNVMRLNYFQGRVSDLPKFGLEPVLVTDDFPQEIQLRACMALSRKAGTAAAKAPFELAAE